MKNNLLKFLTLFVVIIGLSITVFGQTKGQKKPRKPKRNVPKIVIPKREKSPKKDKNKKSKKKKPKSYSEFVISKREFDLA